MLCLDCAFSYAGRVLCCTFMRRGRFYYNFFLICENDCAKNDFFGLSFL